MVQEGLTNALKHAPGARGDLTVRAEDEELRIDLRTGRATSPSTLATSGSGLGLAGLRERLAERDGTLDAGPDERGGWRLDARIPLE